MAIDDCSRPRRGLEAVPDVPLRDLVDEVRAGERTLGTIPTALVETERVTGGALVYILEIERRARESVVAGRWLVGVRDVTDWDALRDAICAKGHDRGLVYRLAVLDDVEVA